MSSYHKHWMESLASLIKMYTYMKAVTTESKMPTYDKHRINFLASTIKLYADIIAARMESKPILLNEVT